MQEETLKVPKGIKITIRAKQVEVTGKHGVLKRDFKHLPIELWTAASGHEVRARMYFAKSKQLSMLRSVSSHINNLFDGDASKFEYRMRLVYAHFPINANIKNNGTTIDLRNLLGTKADREQNSPTLIAKYSFLLVKIYTKIRQSKKTLKNMLKCDKVQKRKCKM